MRSRMRRALWAAAPVLALPVALLAPGTALAGGPAATIHITGQPTLVSGGNVLITVGYSCPPSINGGGAFIAVSLDQPSGLDLGEVGNLVCDSAHHSLTLAVGPVTGTIVAGNASANALLEAANVTAQEQTTVKVKG